jgi:hypothetical protein
MNKTDKYDENAKAYVWNTINKVYLIINIFEKTPEPFIEIR